MATDYLAGHAVVISTSGYEIELTRDDLRVFAAVRDVFPGARAVALRLPRMPMKPLFENTNQRKAKR